MKKWLLRLSVTGVFIFGLLVIIVLNPALLYAHRTPQGQFTLYHNRQLDAHVQIRLDSAKQLVRHSELYDPKMSLNVCLNDGSYYTALLATVRAPAFAWGFHHQVVMQGAMNAAENNVTLNGYTWNLTQLLAHEAVHCMQYDQLGFWKTNPLANIPHWKMEGYPEYVARQNAGQKDLLTNIARLLYTEHTDHNGWIKFSDSTGTVLPYYKAWLLMQYCMDVKKMSYRQVLQESVQGETITKEMMAWYNHQKIRNNM